MPVLCWAPLVMQQQIVAIIFVAAQPKVPRLILPLFTFKAILWWHFADVSISKNISYCDSACTWPGSMGNATRNSDNYICFTTSQSVWIGTFTVAVSGIVAFSLCYCKHCQTPVTVIVPILGLAYWHYNKKYKEFYRILHHPKSHWKYNQCRYQWHINTLKITLTVSALKQEVLTLYLQWSVPVTERVLGDIVIWQLNSKWPNHSNENTPCK